MFRFFKKKIDSFQKEMNRCVVFLYAMLLQSVLYVMGCRGFVWVLGVGFSMVFVMKHSMERFKWSLLKSGKFFKSKG
jgi:hypothetical protein